MTLLGFNIHQVRNQLSQLHICTLTAIGASDLVAQHFQNVLEDCLKLLHQSICFGNTAHLDFCVHLQQLVEAFMAQTKSSKTRQVIQAIPVGLLQSKHKVMQGLCVCFFALGCCCPITVVELLHCELLACFCIQSCQLTISKLGIGFVAIQSCPHSSFNLLNGKRLLLAHFKS